jgi:hypothetical protein
MVVRFAPRSGAVSRAGVGAADVVVVVAGVAEVGNGESLRLLRTGLKNMSLKADASVAAAEKTVTGGVVIVITATAGSGLAVQLAEWGPPSKRKKDPDSEEHKYLRQTWLGCSGKANSTKKIVITTIRNRIDCLAPSDASGRRQNL